jgi:hypothetical protein
VGVVAAAALLALGLIWIVPGFLDRSGSIAPLLLTGLGLGSVALAGVVAGCTLRSFRMARRSEEVERVRGLGPGEFRGALELSSEASGSRDLVRLQQDRVAGALRGLRTGEMLPDSRARVASTLGVTIPIVGLVLLSGTLGYRRDPEGAGRVAAALARPWTVAFPPPPPPMEVTPPGGEVLRGSSFAYRVSAAQRERVYLRSRRPGRPVAEDTLEVRRGAVVGALAPVDEEIRFWVADGLGNVTDTFVVVPFDPLTIVDVELSLHFPRYLDQPDEQLRGSASVVRVPWGTRLDLSVRTNHRLRRFGMVRESEADTDTLWLRTGREGAEGAFVARQSALLSWLPVPVDAVPTADPGAGIRLSVVPDAPPEIRLSTVDRSVLAADGRLPLLVEAADDHGLASVDLEWWRETSGGRREAGHRESLVGDDGSRRVVLRPVLNLSTDGLLPGDEVAILARAADRNPSSPPAMSDTLRVKVSSLRERRAESVRETEALATDLRSLSGRTADLGEAAREAGRRTSVADPPGLDARDSTSRPDYDSTEEARDLLREAERVQEELAKNGERLEALREQVTGSPWPDRELQRQLGELARLMEEIRSSGLGDEIEALSEALERMDRGELSETLSRLSGRSTDLSEQLEQALGLMERVALEQSLEAVRETAAELSSRQRRDLEIETRDEAWGERQEATAAEAEALSDRLQDLAGHLEAEDAMQAARSGREAGQSSRTAAEHLRESADAAKRAEPTDESARSAVESLDQARDQLETAARQLAREWGADSRQVVERAAVEALDLAEEQGRLAEALRQGDSAEDLAPKQAGLREGLDNLTRTLAEAGRKTALLDRRSGPAAARAGREMDAVERTLSGAGGRRTGPADQAEAAAEALSDLAGSLIQSRRAMEQASSATGMEEALEMLARLGRQQADLNDASGDILQMLSGGQPIGNRLRGVADGQEEVAEGLKELAADPATDALAARPGELAAEAEAIARQFESGILTPETVARQERLFRQLLDAGRSLQQDEEDPSRREARAAEPRIAFLPASEEPVRSGPRYPYPDDESMRALDALQRRLVYDYFDRLNRESAEPAP